MLQPKPEFQFDCPICHYTRYRRVHLPRPGKPPYVMPFYSCGNCSLMFLSAQDITRRRAAEDPDAPHSWKYS